MKIASMTHQGLVRLNNEDAVLVDEEAGWIALADGMGGLLAGEEASDVAVTTVANSISSAQIPIDEVLLQAHERVKKHAQEKNYLGKMGTTLVVWRWNEGTPEFCHVGDSRLYTLTASELEQQSHDHTVAQRMIDEGLIPPEEADSAPHQNVLTQALGMPGTLKPQTGTTATAGRILICSDGLSDLVPAAEIAGLLAEVEDIQACAQQLVKRALDFGGRDNVTVAIIDLD